MKEVLGMFTLPIKIEVHSFSLLVLLVDEKAKMVSAAIKQIDMDLNCYPGVQNLGAFEYSQLI